MRGTATESASDPSRPSAGQPPARSSGAEPVGLELVLITALAVVAGVVLRFVTRSALWLDEALSVNVAELPLGEIAGALRQDGHPPLYYYLLHGWIRLFGEGDVAVRSLSGLFAVAALPLAFLAGRRAGGRVLGWVTLGIFALAPFLIRYGTETRMYSLVTLLVLVAYLLLDDIVRRGRDSWWRVGALAVTVGAAFWTHYWAFWPTAAVGVVLAWSWRRGATARTRSSSARALVGLVGGGVLFLPWVPTLLFQSANTGTPWAGPVRPVALLALTFTDLGGGGFSDAQFVGSTLVVLTLLGIFGAGVSARRIEIDLHGVAQFRAEALVLALTVVFGLVVTYVTWSAYATRYAAVFVPLVLLLVAGGVTRFVGRSTRAGVYLVTLGMLAMGGLYTITYDRTQAPVLAEAVRDRVAPGDVVVTCPDQLGPSALRVFPDGLVFVGYPTLDVPDRIDWVDYSERADVDPDAYVSEVLELAGPDHNIVLVWSSTYITHEGTCEALLDAFGRQRPAETLVNEDGSQFYEAANLTIFPAAP